jgi:glycosyltransferase involved in cell wall biosynthesis
MGLTDINTKKGWLVNDTLTCIPGTKTFWHDLLDNVVGLEDKCGGYTPFNVLPNKIVEYSRNEGSPDYIIRNASFFNPIRLNVPTISLLQDLGHGRMDVCNSSTVVVFNSPYTKAHYPNIQTRTETIPLGVDFNFFKPTESYQEELSILDNSILFIGSATNHPKGFNVVMDLINNTDYNFCLVMKDDFQIDHPRVKVFNKIGHDTLLKVINSCSMLICTSTVETQHLSGLEAAACDLPLVVTNVGVYYDKTDGKWGVKVLDGDFVSKIEYVMSNKGSFSPRKFFLERGYDKKDCMDKWKELVASL